MNGMRSMAKLDEFDRAIARTKARKAKYPAAIAARYDERAGKIVVTLDNGLDIGFPPSKAQGLQKGAPSDLKQIEITPSGFGLQFPKLDADLYLPALIDGYFGSKRWAATQLGAAGGRTKTDAKAVASRQNGKLGGRPRKAATA